MIPLSLYIHIPWCKKKCPYCDFNSHMARDAVDESAYVQALLKDLEHDLAMHKAAIGNRPLQTIFIGGGTPSLFSADSIAEILTGIKKQLDCSPKMEVTLEANPGSAEADKFVGFRQAGVTRLSIGVQSFSNQHLQALGRIHNAQEAVQAAQIAKDAGFENFNLDLMFGLPNQTTQQAIADVQQAIYLKLRHLSCYQLTIEPNTLFHHQPPPTPDNESLWEMQTEIQATLAKADYQQYEVSAYAQAEQQCQHNLNYWQFGDYLGIGAGAHGKITAPDGAINRYWKIKHPTSYQQQFSEQGSFLGGENTVEEHDRPFEFMLNALRLTDGFNLALFQQRTSLDQHHIQSQLEKHHSQKLIEINHNHLRLTHRGKAMLNSLIQDYLPE